MKTFARAKKGCPSGSLPRRVADPFSVDATRQAQRAAVRRILRGPSIQTKLTVSAPGDVYEQEADRVADEVMRLPEQQLQESFTCGAEVCPRVENESHQGTPLSDRITSSFQRKTEEELLQTKSAACDMPEMTPGMASAIASMQGGGQPMPPSEQNFFGPRFGQDFSQVRIHADMQAAKIARAINARAFTVGRDVVFGSGEYAPGKGPGRQLLAHELAHVAQQGEHLLSGSGAAKESVESLGRRTAKGEESTSTPLWHPTPKHGEKGNVQAVNRIGSILGRSSTESLKSPIRVARQGLDDELLSQSAEPQFFEVPVTIWTVEDLIPSGYPMTSLGLAAHVYATGHMGWLVEGGGTAGKVFTIGYWAPLAPLPNTVVLDRIANVIPRNLGPRIQAEIAARGPLSWVGKGFTEDELLRIPELVNQFNRQPGTLTARQLEVLRRAAAIHIDESLPGSPLASYTAPGHDIQANLKSKGYHRWRVAVEFDRAAVLDVSRANRFNEAGALRALRNSLEQEWLATAESGGRIVSVQKGSGPPGFAMRNAGAIRWAGRGMVGVGLGLSAVRIGTAAPEERISVIAEETGGQIGGAMGAPLALFGCILLGGVTAGSGLFVCGLVGGFIGGALGSATGGALEADLARHSTPRGSECPSCHELQREWQATGTLEEPVGMIPSSSPSNLTLLDLMESSFESGSGTTPEQRRTFQQWLEILPP